MSLRLPSLLLLSALPSFRASVLPAQADTTRLADVVVTATRSEEPRRSAPATITVVRGDELRARGIRFVIDWLREVPGVTVVQSGSFGGVASLFLRGGESDYTRVLIDGVPVNLPGGSLDLAHLSTDNVERIEVLRGPASVLYGSDAVTGVIHILTRRGAGPPVLRGRARAGTFGTTDVMVGGDGASSRADWSASLSRFGSNGFYPFNNGYRSWTASGRVGVRPDLGSDLAVAVRYGDHQSHFPTDFSGVPSDSNQFTTEQGLTVGIEAGRRVSERVQLRLSGSIYHAEQGFQNAADSPGDTLGFGYAGTRDSRFARRMVDLRAVVTPISPLQLAGGVEAATESERQTSRTTSNFGDGAFHDDHMFDRDRSNLAAYVQGKLGLGPAVDLHLGLRHDDNQVFGPFTTWRSSVVLLPSPSWRVHLATGTAYKQPTFSEQFARTPFEVGDPDLRPERTRTWEVGAEGTAPGGRIGGQAVVFSQRFRDLIEYRASTGDAPTYANVARASADGLELEATVRPVAAVRLGARATWLDTEVLEAGTPGVSFLPGDQLLRRPGFTLAVGGGWTGPSGLRVDADVQRTGARDDVDFRAFPAERVELRPYTLVGASADLPLALSAARRDLGIMLRVENLFDADYQSVVGFPGRGRAILVGLRYGR